MRGFGAFLLAGGLVGAFFFFALFDTSVEVPTTTIMGETIGGGRVNNLGLLSDRQNGLIITLAIAFGGLLLILLAPKDGTDAGEKKCPFCAEWIKADATVCRYCNRDLPSARHYGYRLRMECEICASNHWLFVVSDDVAYKGDVLRFKCPASDAVQISEVGEHPVQMSTPRQSGDVDARIASMNRTSSDSVAERI